MDGATPSRSAPKGLAPDFRNLGVLLRMLLLAEGIKFVFLLTQHGHLTAAMSAMAAGAPVFESALLTTLLMLFISAPLLSRLSFRGCTLAGMTLASMVAMGNQAAFTLVLAGTSHHDMTISGILAALLTGAAFFYLHWRQLALSPALSDARLMALQARIRPHFLYNSLNTVLGLIRQDPARAESVLENLADLFRALMAEARILVPLERELELAKAYVEVESIRLGERLRVVWHCDGAPLQAEVPQLMLQPLIENAVIHGIEPNPEGGEIHINIFVKGGRMLLVVRNPLLPASPRRPGNRMALANIRERLDLHFDAEARMTHYTAGGEFVVQIEIPLRRAAPARQG